MSWMARSAITAMPTQGQSLLDRIRGGDQAAWREFIAIYEGRLLAFVDSRLKRRVASEDVVQETFLGFLVSLPNYDPETPLEAFLFSIAAHKLTDALRREGRRPAISLDSGGSERVPGRARGASSLVRSGERKGTEARVVRECLRQLVADWRRRGEYERLKCVELLFVAGRPNKEAARLLGISEQDVANHKQFVVMKLKEAARAGGLRELAVVGME